MDKVYTIDLNELEDLEKEEIYDLLKESLHLPDYCGTNLDALYDALTEMGDCVINILDCKVHDSVGADNTKYINKIKKVFEDAAEINPCIDLHIISSLYLSRYLSLYDYEYKKGKHYLNASRRNPKRLVYTKSEKDFANMVADAVSCIVILDNEEDGEPKLLLSREYRYPTGHMLLSVPAGLIDDGDIEEDSLISFATTPAQRAAVREIREETGIKLTDKDIVKTVNPLVFSTPGMTDESNALVGVVIRSDINGQLTQDGAEGSEWFDGFEILTKDKAREILKNGVDDNGVFYSVYTCIALMYFVTDLWRED